MVPVNMGRKSPSESAFGVESSRDIAVGPYLLPERLTAQRYRDILETVLPGLLEDVPLSVRQGLWFQRAVGKMSDSG
jgi:hypothetical protein